MKPFLSIFLVVLILLANSCIDTYDPKLVGTIKHLVFDGHITNQEGPYQIRLSFTAGYNSKESVFDSFVLSARVWITDEKNVRTDLEDQNFGYYITPPSFKAQIGKSYKININLVDGRTYESNFELMKPVAEIENVYSEFRPNNVLRPKYRGFFDIFVDTKDPATIGDFYKWKWKHFEKLDFCGATEIVSEPPIRQRKRCCTDCWSIEQCFDCINIASDNFVNGKTLFKQKIAEIPYDDQTLFYLLIEQMSLSREAYNFWKTIDEQAFNSGGIFDVAPGTLRGNIKNLKDENDPAIGYFQVSAVAQKVYYLRRDKVDFPPFSKGLLPQIVASGCNP